MDGKKINRSHPTSRHRQRRPRRCTPLQCAAIFARPLIQFCRALFPRDSHFRVENNIRRTTATIILRIVRAHRSDDTERI